MDKLEKNICRAEVAYKSGQISASLKHAERALKICDDTSKSIALRIFIARAYSKLGYYAKSNTIYRALLRENVYMPPVIMGLMYNNFKSANAEKMRLNISLVKTCLRLQ